MKGSGSITMLTRNLEGEKASNRVPNLMNNWSHNWDPAHRAIRPTETWAGPSNDKRVVMSGMDQGQGQIAFADGQCNRLTTSAYRLRKQKTQNLPVVLLNHQQQAKTSRSPAEVGGKLLLK